MMKIRYVVSMPDPSSHLLRVRLEVRGAPGGSLDLVLPVWTPGSYKVRDYARHLQDFRAGRHAWRKVDKSRWRVQAGGDVDVEYSVFAFELSVQSSYLDSDFASINGAGVFLYVDGAKDAPIEVAVRPPAGWAVHTGLEKRGKVWVAPDYDALVDCPIDCGRQEKRTFKVRGVPHHWVTQGPSNAPPRLLADVKRIVEAEVKLIGEIPYDHYTFLVHHSTERGGGLEHRNSTVLQVPGTAYRPREKYDNVLELVAHEFWHLWNVKRIKPEQLGPFDYEREVYTSLLWVMEGLTSYYDTLIPCRAKLFTPEKYFKRMADRVQKYEEKPGRRRQSLSESSFDTWVKLYQPNENSLNCQMSYYEKGELVGMCLDLEIRHRTRNAKSLDDVMRLLWKQWGREGRGFPEGEFRRACERIAGGSLERFWADLVDGTAEIPWNRFLGIAGCRLEKEPKKPEEGEPARRSRPWLGASMGGLTVSSVLEGSPAAKAGLSAKDELVALNGAKVAAADWDKRLDELEPGERARLTVFRAGFLKELSVTLGAKDNATWTIKPVEKPTAEQRSIYESWLGVKWPSKK